MPMPEILRERAGEAGPAGTPRLLGRGTGPR